GIRDGHVTGVQTCALPIFPPLAIRRTAHHGRRELYVGWPTVEAIVANKLAPGALDHYLGLTGFRSQQTSEREDPGRPDNLWNPEIGRASCRERGEMREVDG